MSAQPLVWESLEASHSLDDRASVPGGWIYRTWHEFQFPDGRGGDWRPVAMVFVPDPERKS